MQDNSSYIEQRLLRHSGAGDVSNYPPGAELDSMAPFNQPEREYDYALDDVLTTSVDIVNGNLEFICEEGKHFRTPVKGEKILYEEPDKIHLPGRIFQVESVKENTDEEEMFYEVKTKFVKDAQS